MKVEIIEVNKLFRPRCFVKMYERETCINCSWERKCKKRNKRLKDFGFSVANFRDVGIIPNKVCAGDKDE